jgi:AraC-like DNA-binding protein
MSAMPTVRCHSIADWNRAAAATFGNIAIRSDAACFAAAMSVRERCGIRLVDVRSAPARVDGAGGMPSNAGWYLLLGLCGPSIVSQRGRDAVLAAGETSVLRADEPWQVRFDQPNRTLVAALPPPADASTERALQARCARRHRSDGAHPLALLLLRSFGMDAAAAAQLDGARLTRSLLDLLLLASPADEESATGLASLRWPRIEACVQSRLSEPDLGARQIADELGVSLRAVQYAFARRGTTVGGHVLEQRLRAAADRLRVEPHASVAQIAFDSGFGDLSHFCRSFRRRFGCSASRWRAAA